MVLRILCCIGLVLSIASVYEAQTENTQPTTPTSQAETLYQAQKWTEAAKAYEVITKAEPNNGRAWYRLGYSLHQTSNYQEAAMAFERAIEKLQPPVKAFAMYNAGASYAKLNNKDKAFEWLTKAVNSGFGQIAKLNTDSDLASLREDARFKELLRLGDRLTKPCLYQSEHKQFDFWVGEWNVETTQGQPAGKNIIERMEQGCILMENWTGAAGGTGKSINFYNASTGKWRQTWVDSTGNVAEYEGEYKDGAMRFDGNPVINNGKKTLRRLTLSIQGPDRVRQLFEQSADDGKTWTTQYDLIYVRKK